MNSGGLESKRKECVRPWYAISRVNVFFIEFSSGTGSHQISVSAGITTHENLRGNALSSYGFSERSIWREKNPCNRNPRWFVNRQAIDGLNLAKQPNNLTLECQEKKSAFLEQTSMKLQQPHRVICEMQQALLGSKA